MSSQNWLVSIELDYHRGTTIAQRKSTDWTKLCRQKNCKLWSSIVVIGRANELLRTHCKHKMLFEESSSLNYFAEVRWNVNVSFAN